MNRNSIYQYEYCEALCGLSWAACRARGVTNHPFLFQHQAKHKKMDISHTLEMHIYKETIKLYHNSPQEINYT